MAGRKDQTGQTDRKGVLRVHNGWEERSDSGPYKGVVRGLLSLTPIIFVSIL